MGFWPEKEIAIWDDLWGAEQVIDAIKQANDMAEEQFGDDLRDEPEIEVEPMIVTKPILRGATVAAVRLIYIDSPKPKAVIVMMMANNNPVATKAMKEMET